MTDIDRLIHINIELEGLLKVLRDRDSIEARSMLKDKIEQYTAAINAFLSSDNPELNPEVKEIEEQAEETVKDEQYTEVKDQEAVEPEVEPEEEAAEKAVIRETWNDMAGEDKTPSADTGTNAKLLKAFTLNDRFRFRRELFGGDDADFTETLKLLADMDSYSEACDYLYNDMMWDRTDANVVDFMAIVAANMPQ